MKRISDLEKKAVQEVLDRDQTCLSGFYKNPWGGPSVVKFETELAEYNNMKYAITVSNGTTALHAALLACGIGPGDEVITTPLTFLATATAILMAGARPVFIDVDPETYNMDPNNIASAMTEKTKAIIPVNLLGNPCNIYEIMEASKGDAFVIEDNAQAFGAEYNKRKTGTIGDISIISLQETKTITSAGEGGVIFTDIQRLAKKCRYLRNHGYPDKHRSHYDDVHYLTYNYRMTEIQAAFGLVQLKRIDEFLQNQRDNAKILLDGLPESFHPQEVSDYANPTYYIVGCTMQDDDLRKAFIKKMTKKGINKNLPGDTVGPGYIRPITHLPVFEEYASNCPVAEVLCDTFIWFDVTRWKTKEETEKIVETINQCIR